MSEVIRPVLCFMTFQATSIIDNLPSMHQPYPSPVRLWNAIVHHSNYGIQVILMTVGNKETSDDMQCSWLQTHAWVHIHKLVGAVSKTTIIHETL